jgi:hypothetical protein
VHNIDNKLEVEVITRRNGGPNQSTQATIFRSLELTTPLYERLTGPAWQQLSENVRRAHMVTGSLRARGIFSVQHGQFFARLLAKLLRLPSPAEATTVQLHVTASEIGEKWERYFGNRRLITFQNATSDNLLAEKFGPFQISFRLHPSAEALSYQQQGAAVGFGRLRLSIPAWLAPQVHVAERSVDDTGRTHVAVSISQPPLGLLIRYEGEFEVEEKPE